jgi:hypothetical protein
MYCQNNDSFLFFETQTSIYMISEYILYMLKNEHISFGVRQVSLYLYISLSVEAKYKRLKLGGGHVYDRSGV